MDIENASIISTNSLTKHFRSVNALTNFSIDIQAGEVVGLLGPNGSGKSTLVRLLLGFLKPTSGSAQIAGFDCESQRIEVHRLVTYLPGDAKLFRTMRGKDVLNFFASIRGGNYFQRAAAIAKRLDLDLSRWVPFMSTGMRQKLALATIMACDTPVIILDEPTANLDPTVRGEVLKLVGEAKTEGRTIIFSSHVLNEIEESCDRVVILRDGELVHAQSIVEETAQHQIRIQTSSALPEIPSALLGRVDWVNAARNSAEPSDNILSIEGDLSEILKWLSSCELDRVYIQPVNLRSIYDRFHSGAT